MKAVRKKGINEEDFLRMVEEKMQEVGGLLDIDAAAMIVAKHLGVDLPARRDLYSLERLYITDIVEGLRRLEITGRVINVDPPLVFYRKGRTIKVSKILLGDKTGTIPVSLWPPHTQIVERLGLSIGDVVKIYNARSKKFRERLELNVGEGSQLQIIDEPPPDIPPLEHFIEEDITTFTDLKILSVCPPVETRTRWGTRRVACIEAKTPDNIHVKIFLWGSKAYWARYLEPGHVILVKGCLREVRGGEERPPEYHVGKYFSIKLLNTIEVEKEVTVKDYRHSPNRLFFNLEGFIAGLTPGRGNTLTLLLSDGKHLASLNLIHEKSKEQVMANLFERNYGRYLTVKYIENIHSRKLSYRTTLWTVFQFQNRFLKKSKPSREIKDIEKGEQILIESPIKDYSFETAYYCSYCFQKIFSVEHDCFAEREVKVHAIPYFRLFLTKENQQFVVPVPPINKFYEKLLNMGLSYLEEFFLENEDPTSIIEYILNEAKASGKKLSINGILLEGARRLLLIPIELTFIS
ncbi:MAG: DUF2240 family protein [Thermoproteales archaeon]|nr:DUF2240 family protein [Thermoproteales archaeon]